MEQPSVTCEVNSWRDSAGEMWSLSVLLVHRLEANAVGLARAEVQLGVLAVAERELQKGYKTMKLKEARNKLKNLKDT